jgi:hypothetical protein
MDIDDFTERMKTKLQSFYGGFFKVYHYQQSTHLYWNTTDLRNSILIFKFQHEEPPCELTQLQVWEYSFDMEHEGDIDTSYQYYNYTKTPEEEMEAHIFKTMQQVYSLIQNWDLLKKQKWALQRKKEIDYEFNEG